MNAKERLAQLGQIEGREAHQFNEANAALAPARAAVTAAYDELVEATSRRDSGKAKAARNRHTQAVKALEQAQLDADAARRRRDRAVAERGGFEQDSADELLAEHAASTANPSRDRLEQALHAVVEASRAWHAAKDQTDRHLRAHPNASPIGDGPPAGHGFEDVARTIKLRLAEGHLPPAPTARWNESQHRVQQNKANRLVVLERKPRASAEEQEEIARLKAELGVTRFSGGLVSSPGLDAA